MPLDSLFPELKAVLSLTFLEIYGPTYEYLCSPVHGVGAQILAGHDDARGIVIVNKYRPIGGTALLVDGHGHPVGIDEAPPSAFDELCERFPDEVWQLVDFLVEFPRDTCVPVFLIHPDGRAEYGPVLLASLMPEG